MVQIAKIHFNKKKKKIFFQKNFKNLKKHVQNDKELFLVIFFALVIVG